MQAMQTTATTAGNDRLMVQIQGRKANENGWKLENVVESLCAKLGCIVVEYTEWVKDPLKYGNEVLIKNFPYLTIYGTRGRMEFYLKSKKLRFEGRIECRFQDVAGSVDEKFPYLFHNCISSTHPKNTLLIVDGDGARSGAKRWFDTMCVTSVPKDYSISIMTVGDFIRWLPSR